MSRPKLKRPAPGTVLGTLALIVAVAGNTGAFASAGHKITKADIAKGAITANAIAPGAVRAKALANNAVHSNALAAGASTPTRHCRRLHRHRRRRRQLKGVGGRCGRPERPCFRRGDGQRNRSRIDPRLRIGTGDHA